MESNLSYWLVTVAGCTSLGYWLAKRRRGLLADQDLRQVIVVNGRELAGKIIRKYRQRPARSEPGADERQGVTRVFLTAQFAADCYRFLTAGIERGRFQESFVYATGVTLARNAFAVSELLPVAFAEQSAGHVRVLDSSNIRTLAELDTRGTALLAHFHSHPGHGATANHPSATDLAFQERLERGGHRCIGGIFARGDGVAHLRFFAGPQRKFVVTIQGTSAREVSKNVFEIRLADGEIRR